MKLLTKKSVLIIDDDPDFTSLFKKQLLKTGEYNIVLAKDGMEGILKSKNQRFKYIFTDLDMPKVSGDEFIYTIRRGQYNHETPIILISSSKKEALKSFQTFENTLFLSKPVDFNDLKSVLKKSKFSKTKDRSQIDLEFINESVMNFKDILTKIGNFKDIKKETTQRLDPTIHQNYDYYGCIIIHSEKFNGIFTVAFPESTFEEYIIECIDNTIIQSSDEIFEAFIQTLVTKTKKMLNKSGDFVNQINSVFGVGHTELLSSRESIIEFYTTFASNKGNFFVQVSIWE
jgi:CheY-like chemotaxis protein